MDLKEAKLIINDDTLTDDQLAVLLERAQNEAINHYFWGKDDVPDDDERAAFISKWKYEIYDIAKALNSDNDRDGLISHTELGIQRTWGESSKAGIQKALNSIPTKVYVI